MTTDEAAAILRRAWAHVEDEGDTFARVLTREHRGEAGAGHCVHVRRDERQRGGCAIGGCEIDAESTAHL